MKLHTLLPCMAGALLLAACAADGGRAPPPATPSPTLAQMMNEADVAARAGQQEKAQALLRGAGAGFPAEKAPWLQMAQMKFDRGIYGDAIVNAQQALQRDPNDKLANSIVAVSGLRLSTRALADLTRQNNLSGSLRSEAQDLAKLLRASLGEEVLVPHGAAHLARHAPVPQAKKGAPAAPSKSSLQGGSVDPFSGLSK